MGLQKTRDPSEDLLDNMKERFRERKFTNIENAIRIATGWLADQE